LRRHTSAAALLAGLALRASPLHAQGQAPAQTQPPVGTPDTEAKRVAGHLLEQGLERVDAGDFAGALERFESAYRVFPSPKILVNIGHALLKLGRETEAAAAYERFLAAAPSGSEPAAPADEKRVLARQQLERLRLQLGRLWLALEPASATLRLDGARIVPLAGGLVYVRPGVHQIEAEAPGYERRTLSTEVAAAREQPVALRLTVSAPPPELTAAHETRDRAGAGKRRWGLITAAAGGVLLASGLVLGLEARSKSDELMRTCGNAALPCSPAEFRDLDSAGQNADQAAKILWAAGGAAVLAGGILYVWGRSEARTAGLSFAIIPGRGAALLSCRSIF